MSDYETHPIGTGKRLEESKKVVENLMKSHEELLAGVGGIVCDIGLLNTCRIDGDKYLRTFE